jgi:hypothetical protein
MISEKYANAYKKQFDIESMDKENGFIHRNEQDYLEDCMEVYYKYCSGKPLKEQILIWLTLLRNPEPFGLKTAFTSNSPELLNDVLFQSNSIKHAKLFYSSGYDHCSNIELALLLLAGGMNERFPTLLPEEFGMSKNGHIVTKSTVNLIMTLWYKRADFEEESRKMAKRVLGTKQSGYDYAKIRYLIALLDGDVAEASNQLDLYCRSVSRVQEYGITKLKKMFWPEAHGLYNLAFVVWEKEKALKIQMPTADCFCNDLARWQIEHNFRQGKMFLEYPEPINLINHILQCSPPTYTIYQPYLNTKERYKNAWYVNGDLFKEQLIERVMDYCTEISFKEVVVKEQREPKKRRFLGVFKR